MHGAALLGAGDTQDAGGCASAHLSYTCPLHVTPLMRAFALPPLQTQAARGAVSAAAASSGIAGDVTQWASSLFSTGAAASMPGGASR